MLNKEDMDILFGILAIMGLVMMCSFGGMGCASMFSSKKQTATETDRVPWNSYRHSVEDIPGKFIVEKAFKTKRNHFAMRLKNLITGESRTVYGQSSSEVSVKAKDIFDRWQSQDIYHRD